MHAFAAPIRSVGSDFSSTEQKAIDGASISRRATRRDPGRRRRAGGRTTALQPATCRRETSRRRRQSPSGDRINRCGAGNEPSTRRRASSRPCAGSSPHRCAERWRSSRTAAWARSSCVIALRDAEQRGAPDGPPEERRDLGLEHLIGRQANRVLGALRLQVLVHVGQGEGGIAAQEASEGLATIPRDHRVEHLAPAVGALNAQRLTRYRPASRKRRTLGDATDAGLRAAVQPILHLLHPRLVRHSSLLSDSLVVSFARRAGTDGSLGIELFLRLFYTNCARALKFDFTGGGARTRSCPR
jgi:hypothetical protein